MTPQEKVRYFVDIAEKNPDVDLDELVELLRCETIDEEEAECLIAFVPMAFAHAILAPAGVRLPSGFLVRDFDTGADASGRLREEPIFVAARAIADKMLNAGPPQNGLVRVIASSSAEMNVARQLSRGGEDLKDIVLIEAVLMRVPIEHLQRKRARRFWEFWK